MSKGQIIPSNFIFATRYFIHELFLTSNRVSNRQIIRYKSSNEVINKQQMMVLMRLERSRFQLKSEN